MDFDAASSFLLIAAAFGVFVFVYVFWHRPKVMAGKLICRSCGESNLPVARFCRRCGRKLI